MATRSLKALVASCAVAIALFVAAAPAAAKPGGGNGRGGKQVSEPPTYDWCPAGYTCVVFPLS